MVNAWDQRSGEPDTAYARFLIYRNLGPARSTDAAYKASKPKRKAPKSRKSQGTASGQWTKDCAAFDWPERATAWDIDQLSRVGTGTVLSFVSSLQEVANKTLEGVRKYKPRSWKESIVSVRALGSFIPAETVEAIRDLAESGETPALGAIGRDEAE